MSAAAMHYIFFSSNFEVFENCFKKYKLIIYELKAYWLFVQFKSDNPASDDDELSRSFEYRIMMGISHSNSYS